MSDVMVLMLAGLGGEIVLLLLLALSVSWFRQRAARKRDIMAVQALTARIRKGKAEREAAIEAFLGGSDLAGDARVQAKVGLLRAELGVLQRFAAVYKKRDAAAAARFDADLFAACDVYHGVQGGGDGQIIEAEVAAESGDTEALRRENKRLTEELTITMETMSRMLNEYSLMFAGGSPEDVTPSMLGVAVGATAGDVGASQPADQIADDLPVGAAVDQPADDDIEVAVAEDLMADAEEEPAADEVVLDGADLASVGDDVEVAEDLVEGDVEVAAIDEAPGVDAVEIAGSDDVLVESTDDATAMQQTKSEPVGLGDDDARLAGLDDIADILEQADEEPVAEDVMGENDGVAATLNEIDEAVSLAGDGADLDADTESPGDASPPETTTDAVDAELDVLADEAADVEIAGDDDDLFDAALFDEAPAQDKTGSA